MRSLILLAGIALLAGCANLPNVPGGLPIPGVPSLPGSSSTGITAQQVTQVVSAVQTINTEFTEPQEIELGQGIAQSMLGAAPLVRNDRLQRYVNQVGRWVANQSDRPNLPWQFGVLDNENINAFAAPGGVIFITNGLLKKLQSESELAGVLGHEIAHVIQKHHLKAFQQGGYGELGKVLAQGVIDNKLGKSGVAGQVAKAAGVGEMGGELVKQGAFVKALDRDLEYEADRMGVILAARAGYDPYGLVAALQMLQAQATDDPFLALLFKTHPGPGDRITQLEKLAATLDRFQNQDQGRERFAAATGIRAPAVRPVSTPGKASPAPAKAAPAKTAPAVTK